MAVKANVEWWWQFGSCGCNEVAVIVVMDAKLPEHTVGSNVSACWGCRATYGREWFQV